MNQEKLCRICTKKGLNLQNLFDSQRTLLKQILELTGLKLRNVKELPQQICEFCQVALEDAHRFRLLCLQSQKYFKTAEYRNKVKATCAGRKPSLNEKSIFKNELDHSTTAQNIRILESVKEEDDEPLSQLLIKKETAPAVEEHESTAGDINHLTQLPVKMKSTAKNRFKTRKKRSEDVPCEFICETCGNNFSCRHHFLTHLRRHTGEKPYQCEVCPDKFFTHSELNRHMRKHTGERPFACQHCGRRFTDYSTRLKHERTHTNTRPFACAQCGKAFTTSYILKNHILTHTGERSFRCALCNKSFQRQTHLVVHYRSLAHKQNDEKQKQQAAIGIEFTQ